MKNLTEHFFDPNDLEFPKGPSTLSRDNEHDHVIWLFMSLDPTIMGSKLSNSQIIVVVIMAQCRATKKRRLSGRVIFLGWGRRRHGLCYVALGKDSFTAFNDFYCLTNCWKSIA